jgi:dihydrofolate synthase/folylpolyglutamate synthase
MNYQETLEYLFSQLPMFQRIGQAAYKANLDNTYSLLKALGNPHQSEVKYVHVAGTNGKGSVSSMIASALQEAGYKTGLFTSPHLKDFRERIKINGQTISENEVVAFVEKHRNAFEEIKPSFFEMTAALAFKHFTENKVDIAVLETGMGGRLDSTNVVVPEVSVITNIGLDHTQFLGDTISAIAMEKAGIIKKAIPVVIGKLHPDALKVMEQTALKHSAKLITFKEEYNQYHSDLKGDYQQWNVPVAVAALKELKQNWNISDAHISSGLNKVIANTGLLGRWQTLQTLPLCIADVAHNKDGIYEVLKQIEKLEFTRLHFVIGVVGDKDLNAILALLPKTACYYFCQAQIPRALDKQLLKEKASEFGLIGEVYNSVAEAFNTSKSMAKATDLVFVGGSVFTVAEVV